MFGICYEIISSIHIGDREIAFGLDEKAEMPYFCAFYRWNAVFGAYEDGIVDDDYVKIVERLRNASAVSV